MRGRLLFLFASLLLLFNLSGCAANGEKSGTALNESGQMENSEAPDSGKQEITNDNDSGVILDTVVDVFREASTQSDRLTQAIFNQPAQILEEKDNWVKVKVADGYTGWIKSKYIGRDISSIRVKGCKYRVVVTSKNAKVLSEAKYGAVLKEVVMGTEFYPVDSNDGWYKVALPEDKTGWLNETGTIHIPVDKNISKTSADDFVATAMKFKGAVYLWGGVSAWGGIDCSGLTYISGRINGVDLPRAADKQYKCGEAVSKDLKLFLPGDLLFFSTNEDLRDISNVGIYIGNDQILYASKSLGSVTVGSMNDSYFQKRLVGARRIF